MSNSLIESLLNNSSESRNWDSAFVNISYFGNISQGYLNLPYYGNYLLKYQEKYGSLHGYLSLVVCIFGITANILNIIVLTRKNMASPTNAILTGLAVADMMVMFSYLPFAYHNYIREDLKKEEKFSYGSAVFTLFHAHFSIVNHTISIWLTVTVAIWRFMAVSFPSNAVRYCSMPRAKCAILSTYVAGTIVCIPEYLTFTVRMFEEDGYAMYRVDFSEISQKHGKLLEKINFWFFSVITKLVPCVALTGLSFGLINVLYETNLRRQRLKIRSESESIHDRTTRMLLVVLLLFLLTEFPSGILALLSGILGTEFFDNVYLNFAETMDALALINNAINFIIYCSMSRQFRDTFRFLFIPKVLTRTLNTPTSQQTAHTAV